MMLLASASADAANYTWQGTGSTGSPTSGTWSLDASNLAWSSTTGSLAWSNTNAAIFGGADGTYAVNVDSSFGGIVASGLTFNASGYTLDALTSGTLTLTNGSTTPVISVASGKTASIGSNLTLAAIPTSGTPGITFGGGGTLNLSGSLYKVATQNNGNVTISGGSTLNVLTGGYLTGGGGSIVLGSGVTNDTLNVNGGTVAVSYYLTPRSMVLANSSGATSTVNLNSGAITFDSNSGNMLRFGPTTAPGAATAGTFNLNGGVLTVGNILESSASGTPTPSDALNYSSTFNFNGGTLRLAFGGGTVIQAVNNVNVKEGGAIIDTVALSGTLNTATTPLVHSGTNAVDGGLTKLGTGTLTLMGTNTYNGTTTLTAGNLNVGSVGALSGGGNILFNGGTLQYSSINTLDYASRIKNSTGAIAIDSNGQAVVFTGALDSSNVGGLVKTGSGTLTLSASNAYAGTTVVSSGTLAVDNSNALGSGDVSVTSGGSLQLAGGVSFSKNLSLVGGGSSSPGLKSLSGTNTWSGPIAADTSAITRIEATAGALNLNGTVTTSGANASGLVFQGAGEVVVNGKITGNGTVTKGGSFTTTLTLNSTNDYTGGTVISRDGVVNIGADNVFGSGLLTVNGFTENTFSMSSVNGSHSVNNNVLLKGPVRFTGSNSLTLSGTTTYTDTASPRSMNNIVTSGTVVLGGTVNITDADVTSRTLSFRGGAGSTTLVSGVIQNNSAANTVGSGISMDTSGSVILGGNNTFTGNTTINSGKLFVSGGIANSPVIVGGTASLTTSAILGGSGVVGAVTLTNNATGAEVNPGNSTGVAGILTTGALTVNSGAHLSMDLGGTTAGGETAAGYDRIVASSVTLSGADLKLTLTGNGFTQNSILFLVVNGDTNPISGSFGTLNGVALTANQQAGLDSFFVTTGSYTQEFKLSYTADFGSNNLAGGNDVALLVVPEPSTWLMLLSGAGVLVGFRRSRKFRA